MDGVVAALLAEAERAVARARELAGHAVAQGTVLRELAARTDAADAAGWSGRAALGFAAQRADLAARTLRAASGCHEVADLLRRHAAAAEERLLELRLLALRVEEAQAAAGAAARRLEAAGVGAAERAGDEVRRVTAAADDARRVAGALTRRLREELPGWGLAG